MSLIDLFSADLRENLIVFVEWAIKVESVSVFMIGLDSVMAFDDEKLFACETGVVCICDSGASKGDAFECLRLSTEKHLCERSKSTV